MSVFVLLYLIIYAALVGGVVFIGFLIHLQKSTKNGNHKTISVDEITLFIPFRNEENRLDPLLSSLAKSHKLPGRIVFIDDHSTDESVARIRQQLKDITHEIVSLNDGVSGKKQALRVAIESCDSTYILTFDADISFEPTYFEAIESLEEADMYVLPAILIGKSPLELFYELDVVLANALNTGLSGISRPIFSSGANFLYKKKVFEEVDNFASHAHMASGDDTYLLRDFRKNRKDIRVVSNLSVAIFTETPHSFKEFLDQRLRWVGKTTDIGDQLASVSAIGQFVLAITFFALMIGSALGGNWFGFSLLFLLKIGMDLLFFLPFFWRTKRMLTWCLIPIYEIVFPLYALTLGILMLTYRPKWKGRALHSNNS